VTIGAHKKRATRRSPELASQVRGLSLDLVDRGGARSLHKVDGGGAIHLIVVAFTGRGDDAVIARIQAPTPVSGRVAVNLVVHEKRSPYG